MASRMQVYKCEICGNIVEVLHGGKGELVCCNKPMKLMEEQSSDWKTEKHVPVISRDGEKINVVVGSTEHPMTDEHYIEWIEIVDDDGRICRKHLNPGDSPETHFLVCDKCGKGLYAREYCNIHGHWSNKE